MRKLKQIDVYPNGRIVKFYDDGSVKIEQSNIKTQTPEEALRKRLQEKRGK